MPELSGDVLRGYIDTIILRVLMLGDSYGYEISKRVREISEDQLIIKETTLYSAINRMGKNGLINAYAGTVTHGKPRTYYHITDAGNAFFNTKVEEWQLTRQVISKFIF